MTNPSESTGFGHPSEAKRPPEYIQARNGFVGSVNDFLDKMAERQAAGEWVVMPGGLAYDISDQSRLPLTYMGPTALPKTRGWLAAKKPGISLIGDGKTSPRNLQAIYPNEFGGVTTVEITGTSPMLPRTGAGDIDFARGQQHIPAADLHIILSLGANSVAVMRSSIYKVAGNGQVNISPKSLEPQPSYFQPLIDGMRMGQLALDEITDRFGLG